MVLYFMYCIITILPVMNSGAAMALPQEPFYFRQQFTASILILMLAGNTAFFVGGDAVQWIRIMEK